MNNNCNANMNCNGKPACSCGGTCQNQDMTCQQLLDVINQASFAVDDMLLYLDTHPDDMEALAYYQKQSCIRREALQKYARQYGPLTIDLVDDTCSDSWEWMSQPWPWELSKKGRC